MFAVAAVALALLLVTSTNCALTELCQHSGQMSVEVIVFSGSKNPSFKLDRQQRNAFCAAVEKRQREKEVLVSLPTCRIVGFTGFEVCRVQPRICAVLRGLDESIDAMLLKAAVESATPTLSDAVVGHIEMELRRLRDGGGDKSCSMEIAQLLPGRNDSCEAAVRGPNDPSKVHFDPAVDDDGCFVTRQSDNNCYDYSVDISSNTFAQPGRASGRCQPDSRPCVNNTCDDVRAAAESDGLKWYGMDLPTSLPVAGHYVSLHIWPGTNFHWLRMDANKYWSHKPGASPVRNVDNKNRLIMNPGEADISPWSEHCGYLLAVPSAVNVTEAYWYSPDAAGTTAILV